MSEVKNNNQEFEPLTNSERIALMAMKSSFNFEELALYTGYKVKHLKNMHSRGILPYSKPNNGKVFFPKAKIDEWLLTNQIRGDAELDALSVDIVSNLPE